jgi:N-acetylglucosamine-6-phosphate deacetylase
MPRVVKFENVRVLRDGQLQDTDLWVEDGKVIDPATRFWRARSDADHAPDEVVDGRGCIASPGFIDVQLNGGFGFDFSNPTTQERDVLSVRQRLVATGVTAFCPTLVSSSAAVYAQIMSRYAPTTDGAQCKAANIMGIHLEGPFINVERKGAHDENVLLAPVDGLQSLEDRYGSLEHVRIITLAPELPGAPEAIRALSARGIVVSGGHSQANIATATDAVECGLTMLTYVFWMRTVARAIPD